MPQVISEQVAESRYLVRTVGEQLPDGTILYVASHPELEGCMGQGETPQEALEDLNAARELYISTLLKRGIPVPEPRGGLLERAADLVQVEVEVLALSEPAGSEEGLMTVA